MISDLEKAGRETSSPSEAGGEGEGVLGGDSPPSGSQLFCCSSLHQKKRRQRVKVT